jgi:hypothetical protein
MQKRNRILLLPHSKTSSSSSTATTALRAAHPLCRITEFSPQLQH